MTRSQFTSVPVAARRLGLPVRSLERAVAAGDLPSIRLGRFVRVDPEVIRERLEARERDAEGAKS